jgi:hypothetical protein
MKNRLSQISYLLTIICIIMACGKPAVNQTPSIEAGLVNTTHLNLLYTPVTFSTGTNAAGIYIYCEAPDYHLVEAAGEGFACVDDVARAAQVYLRSSNFSADTAMQTKAFNLLRFMLEMQSDNGYFYNFVFTSGLINKAGITSINNPNWWSWRALQTLTEAAPLIKNMDVQLFSDIDAAINKLVPFRNGCLQAAVQIRRHY